jgi:short subunit dehydrogenase-like uncharacterized protein
MPDYPFLLYGAYGYTGSLIAEHAVEQGLKPLLAGRDPERLRRQANRLGLDCVAFSLDQSAVFDQALQRCSALFHCAGPFHRTFRPAIAACLRTGRHYLDITGEVPVFEGLAELDPEARSAGIMLMPGVGFDVVPSDCLAVYLKQRLPSANHMRLAIRALGGGVSRGTALTTVESIDQGSAVRRDGRLVQIPVGSLRRSFDFGNGPRQAVAIRWGDLSTAYRSTGIPHIETYATFPPSVISFLPFFARLGGLLRSSSVQALMRAIIARRSPGPSAVVRQSSRSRIVGEAWDDQGRQVSARLDVPEGYFLTALTSITILQKILAGQVAPGFQTPAGFYGADLILEIPTVVRQELSGVLGSTIS